MYLFVCRIHPPTNLEVNIIGFDVAKCAAHCATPVRSRTIFIGKISGLHRWDLDFLQLVVYHILWSKKWWFIIVSPYSYLSKLNFPARQLPARNTPQHLVSRAGLPHGEHSRGQGRSRILPCYGSHYSAMRTSDALSTEQFYFIRSVNAGLPFLATLKTYYMIMTRL